MIPGYATHAAAYLERGWLPFPLPRGKKIAPPEGYTGKRRKLVNADDVAQWSVTNPDGNLGTAIPEGVVGIDVDHYIGDDGQQKMGGYVIAILTSQLGVELPRTWINTSRDLPSGQMFFRIPAGTILKSNLPGGVDILQVHHRYACAAPSWNDKSGAAYHWIDPDGVVSDLPPYIHDLPELPTPWLNYLTEKPEPRRHDPATTHTPRPVASPQDQPCRATQALIDEMLPRVTGAAGTRHDEAIRAALTIARYADQGHAGTLHAATIIGNAFAHAVSTRDRNGAYEWTQAMESACQRVAEDPTPAADKGCCGATVTELRPLNALSDTVPAPTPASIPVPTPEQPDDEESTWKPVNLDDHYDGKHDETVATLLKRDDGHGLLYPARLHSFYGEPESGKSWLAQIATAHALNDGLDVVYIDFEADAGDIIERLTLLGADRPTVTRHLRYLHPEGPRQPEDPYWQALLVPGSASLVIIDGVTEALTMWGGESKDNDAITRWMRIFPKAIARATGAAVVVIDHVTKDKDTRGRYAIGGQAKLATIDGAAYLVEPVDAIAPGAEGRLTVRVTKDRPGKVRKISTGWRKADRTQEAVSVVIDSRHDRLKIRLETPLAEEQVTEIKRDKLDRKICEYILSHPGATQGMVLNHCRGEARNVRAHIRELIDAGYLVDTGKGEERSKMILYGTDRSRAEYAGVKQFDGLNHAS